MMTCHVIINGTEYELPDEDVRTAEQRIRMTIGGEETILRIRVSGTAETAALHLLPNSIATYAVFETA